MFQEFLPAAFLNISSGQTVTALLPGIFIFD